MATSPSNASSTIRRSARRTKSDRPAAVPNSPFINARSSSRVRSGADSLAIGMLPHGPRRQPKARFPVAIQAGCIPTPFPASLRLRQAKAMAAQSWERSERRRLIKLLSAGWVPPSVSSSRGFPLSKGRASGANPATLLATGVPHLLGSTPGSAQRQEGTFVLCYAGATSRPIAHSKAAISRAIAATTTGSLLPVAPSRR